MNKSERSASIATVIKELRQMTGLSQSKFGEKFSISVSNIQHWEQGISIPPKYVVGMMEDLLQMESMLQETGDDDIDKDTEELRKEVRDKILLRGWAITLLHAIAESYVVEARDMADDPVFCTFSDERLQELLNVSAGKVKKNVTAAMSYIFDHPYVFRTDERELHQMWVLSVSYTKGKGLEAEPNASLLDTFKKISESSELDYGLSDYL